MMQSSPCNGKKNVIARKSAGIFAAISPPTNSPSPNLFRSPFPKNFPQTLPPLSAPLKFIMLKFQFPFLHDILHFVVFCFAAVKISSKDIFKIHRGLDSVFKVSESLK